MHASTPKNYTETNFIHIMLSILTANITNNNISKLKLHIS